MREAILVQMEGLISELRSIQDDARSLDDPAEIEAALAAFADKVDDVRSFILDEVTE